MKLWIFLLALHYSVFLDIAKCYQSFCITLHSLKNLCKRCTAYSYKLKNISYLTTFFFPVVPIVFHNFFVLLYYSNIISDFSQCLFMWNYMYISDCSLVSFLFGLQISEELQWKYLILQYSFFCTHFFFTIYLIWQ